LLWVVAEYAVTGAHASIGRRRWPYAPLVASVPAGRRALAGTEPSPTATAGPPSSPAGPRPRRRDPATRKNGGTFPWRLREGRRGQPGWHVRRDPAAPRPQRGAPTSPSRTSRAARA